MLKFVFLLCLIAAIYQAEAGTWRASIDEMEKKINNELLYPLIKLKGHINTVKEIRNSEMNQLNSKVESSLNMINSKIKDLKDEFQRLKEELNDDNGESALADECRNTTDSEISIFTGAIECMDNLKKSDYPPFNELILTADNILAAINKTMNTSHYCISNLNARNLVKIVEGLTCGNKVIRRNSLAPKIDSFAVEIFKFDQKLSEYSSKMNSCMDDSRFEDEAGREVDIYTDEIRKCIKQKTARIKAKNATINGIEPTNIELDKIKKYVS